ncbi:pyridoxal phosphate-dependent transferase [Amylostereum chailletii]|nr:pyridoxal phosphate-dependent transferase [Amylostereum chailletii]
MPSTWHSQESPPLTTILRTSTDDLSTCTLDNTVGGDSSLRDIHPAISSWFLGPKAENGDALNNYVSTILKDLVASRRKYAPEDEESISAATMSSPSFIENTSKLKATVEFLSDFLPQHNVPFYSPRYMAHMANEVSLPAILGNLMASLYNQNNLAPPGGPLTTVIEFDVGQQLCKMLGFSVTQSQESLRTAPTAWGHITCDGSVANTEAMWAGTLPVMAKHEQES